MTRSEMKTIASGMSDGCAGNAGELRLAILYGSTREGRLCDEVAAWVAAQAGSRQGFSIDPIDPLLLGLPTRHEHRPGTAVRALRERLAAADAFVVVTPEYNHGYPAALKQLIDSAGEEWQAKPVAFVSYGGISGGLAELHAVTIRDGVSFADIWSSFDANGALAASGAAREAAARMLAQLRWWAKTLRDARAASPAPAGVKEAWE